MINNKINSLKDNDVDVWHEISLSIKPIRNSIHVNDNKGENSGKERLINDNIGKEFIVLYEKNLETLERLPHTDYQVGNKFNKKAAFTIGFGTGSVATAALILLII